MGTFGKNGLIWILTVGWSKLLFKDVTVKPKVVVIGLISDRLDYVHFSAAFVKFSKHVGHIFLIIQDIQYTNLVFLLVTLNKPLFIEESYGSDSYHIIAPST